jgi:nucleoside-diphosphate-sugar epimerase
MKVVIAGGHGQIALRLTRLLHQRGDSVASIIRKPEQEEAIKEAGGEPIVCDLERANAEEIARAIGTADAVVFAAGAGPGSGAERKWTVDHGAAVKLMDAAKLTSIDRYVMISSRGADPNAPGDDVFTVYLRAKGKADEELKQSGLGYTIIRPHALTDDPGTGKVRIATHLVRGKVPRDDGAAALVATLDEPAAIGKSFELTEGDHPVEQALRSL